jgi:hypothetical protein
MAQATESKAIQTRNTHSGSFGRLLRISCGISRAKVKISRSTMGNAMAF